MKYTRTALKKLETIFNEQDYKVRYEKGTFQSGYCIVEDKKVVVINKFFDTEGRINCLLDILSMIVVMEDRLTPPSKLFFRQILKAQKIRQE